MTIFFIITIPSLLISSRAVGKEFSIENYWDEGGTMTFEDYYTLDRTGSSADLEITSTGIYSYITDESETTSTFNYTVITPPQKYGLLDFTETLNPQWLVYIQDDFDPKDEIDYNFSVSNGYVEFFVLTENQYSMWNERYPFSTENITAIHTNTSASGTIKISAKDQYYFLWFNDPFINANKSITLIARLDVRVTQKIASEMITIDSITGKTSEGKIYDDFGMDTSGWKVEDEITIEIDKKEVYFTIAREEELTIKLENKTTKIPCWVLEKENYERNYLEEEQYTIIADFTLWKSKYSGMTLKTTADIEYYEESSNMFATAYNKITIEEATKVRLIAKTGFTPYPIIPVILGIITFYWYSRKKKKKT